MNKPSKSLGRLDMSRPKHHGSLRAISAAVRAFEARRGIVRPTFKQKMQAEAKGAVQRKRIDK